MRYIFLNVDGVLNSELYLLSQQNGQFLNPASMRILSEICKRYDAKVVLTAHLRTELNDDLTPALYDEIFTQAHPENGVKIDGKILTKSAYLLEQFKKYNIPLFGKVDNSSIYADVSWQRGTKIAKYVKEHLVPHDDSYIILDSEDVSCFTDPEISDELELHLVLTERSEEGLTARNLSLIDYIFKKDHNSIFILKQFRKDEEGEIEACGNAGYFFNYSEAVRYVEKNLLDISNKGYYNVIAILEVAEGCYQISHPQRESWYEFINGQYQSIERPSEFSWIVFSI